MKRKIEKKKKAGIIVLSILVATITMILSSNVTADDYGNPEEFVGEVTVVLNATDDWSGVAETWYCYDWEFKGMTSYKDWALYDGPFNLSAQGNYTIGFYSIDNEGNQEDVKSSSFTILWDSTPPVTTIKLNGDTEY